MQESRRFGLTAELATKRVYGAEKQISEQQRTN